MMIRTTPAQTIFFIRLTLANNFESARPTRLLKEVRKQICELLNSILYASSTVFVGIRFVGPVDNQRFSHDQIAWNKSPVTAVRTVVAVVAHGEVVPVGNNNFTVFLEVLIPIRIFIYAVVDKVRVRLGRKEISERICVRPRRTLVNLVRFGEGLVV